MLYRERTDSREAFAHQIFTPFCNAVGHGKPHQLADILYGRYVVEDAIFGDIAKYQTIHAYFQEVVIPHKIAVYHAGKHLSEQDWFQSFVPEALEVWLDNLWLHDLSKFSAEEAYGYAQYNFKTGAGRPAFELAWHHHKNHNPHHPEYWLSVNRSGLTTPLRMPRIFIVEMVADWIGAGEVYGGSLQDWLSKNLPLFRFHQDTAQDLRYVLEGLDFKMEIVQ